MGLKNILRNPIKKKKKFLECLGVGFPSYINHFLVSSSVSKTTRQIFIWIRLKEYRRFHFKKSRLLK